MSLLIPVGISGLGYVFNVKHNEDVQTAKYRAIFTEGQDDYLEMYQKWSLLSEEQRAETTWGQGEYGGKEATEKLKAQQPERLKADIADLANGVKQPHVMADLLYGPGWKNQVNQYRSRMEITENIAIASTICVAAGVIVAIGFSSRIVIRRIIAKKGAGTLDLDNIETTADAPVHADKPQSVDEDDESVEKLPLKHKEKRKNEVGYFEAASIKADKKESKPMVSVTTPEKVQEPTPPSAPQEKQTGFADFTSDFESPAQQPAVATLMSTAPVGTDSLTELTQEMSAIREFASQQQDQVRRLQDGYDWNIIKRFCIRFIRCVDNLDTRIERLEKEKQETMALEDVRDELVFALESSGVEQFEPEVETDYKGNEKTVEAVKTRQKTTNAKLKGKIAKVVRPGYQYVVSDNDVKIVRCSQVKLYGEN